MQRDSIATDAHPPHKPGDDPGRDQVHPQAPIPAADVGHGGQIELGECIVHHLEVLVIPPP